MRSERKKLKKKFKTLGENDDGGDLIDEKTNLAPGWLGFPILALLFEQN